MTHFYVDDQFPFHPKALLAGNAALGLWVRAGAWCKANVTGGFVSTEAARSMGSAAEIKKLITARLWVPVDGGYHFHDWTDTAGNDTAEIEAERREAERKKNRDRQAALRERRRLEKEAAERNAANAAGNTPSNGVTNGGSNAVNTPPVTESPSPSPSPSPTDQDMTSSSHPGEREISPQDDDRPVERGVNFDEVADAIRRYCGKEATQQHLWAVLGTVETKARASGTRIGNRTKYVIAAIKTDPFVYAQIIDELAVAS